MPVHLNNEQSHPLDQETWQRRAEALHLAAGLSLTGDEWSLTWVDAASIHALNREYRAVDRPTDVLAFALEEAEGPALPGGGRLLGDVVVAVDVAAAQAEARGHTLADELALLMVHGLLHLLGEDHDTPARKARMWRRQGALLEALGVPPLDYGDAEPARLRRTPRRRS
ncbi:MAG: rRNA maturation RNase YbeY [Candidatus Sericytochromatia bacterium]|nr:rRNA maturation RNase YbeY [Candidatus Sericytochromatia bacterium]